MLANRPRSSTRQGRLIFSAPAKSPSVAEVRYSLHTRTKLRQFNSGSAVVQPSGLIIPSKIQYEFARVVSRQSCRQIWGLPVPDDVHFYGHRRDIAQLLATVQRAAVCQFCISSV